MSLHVYSQNSFLKTICTFTQSQVMLVSYGISAYYVSKIQLKVNCFSEV